MTPEWVSELVPLLCPRKCHSCWWQRFNKLPRKKPSSEASVHTNKTASGTSGRFMGWRNAALRFPPDPKGGLLDWDGGHWVHCHVQETTLRRLELCDTTRYPAESSDQESVHSGHKGKDVVRNKTQVACRAWATCYQEAKVLRENIPHAVGSTVLPTVFTKGKAGWIRAVTFTPNSDSTIQTPQRKLWHVWSGNIFQQTSSNFVDIDVSVCCEWPRSCMISSLCASTLTSGLACLLTYAVTRFVNYEPTWLDIQLFTIT